ncbi:hypothetical protein HYV69_00210 [Candidatus Uhrbacteria bacterium]|nr:hypothetical protein [Candidatus Uhrbacteria bacterium]
MPIRLKIRKDLSLNDLVSLKRAGFLVFKTPHIGNWYPNNLACATLGIPMKIVDSTKGCLDRNFHPHCVIVNGTRTQIAEENVLISHAKVTRVHEHTADRFQIGASIPEVHMQALRELFPELEMQTVSEYLKENCCRVLELLEVLTQHDHSIWERYVRDDGMTEARHARQWAVVNASGVCGTNGSNSGWVSPNITNILMDVTIDPLKFNTDIVYELSGPDMYKYIGQLMSKLNELYEVVRQKLWPELPQTVTLNLVPVADMRFAVPAHRRQALEELVDVLKTVAEFENGIGGRINSAPDREKFICQIVKERNVLHDSLREVICICPDPFYDIYDGTFFSQYDLLSCSESLFIHPWALETSVGVLSDLVRIARGFLPA